MLVMPPAAEPLIESFRSAFTRPSFERFVCLTIGAIVTFGRRTVSRILWTLGPAAGPGDPSSYHRLFSAGRWSLWLLGKILAAMVLELVPEDQPVVCPMDDSVAQHRGRRVYGKGCHRDAVRSSAHGGTHTVTKWGHRWVTLAILVRLPLVKRPWALPVLCALYRPPRVDQEEGRRHKTPCDLARQLLATLLHWFPDRRFVALGDGGFASHDLACFCHRHRDRLTLIARGLADMNLHALPQPPRTPTRQTLWRRRCRGVRPRCRKGRKLPSPRATVHAARKRTGRLPQARLPWYGQSIRNLELLSACGGWYRGRGNGQGALVPLRWTYTRDQERGREDWFYCTDPTLRPHRIVELFAGRWSIEVTFEEVRAHLGWETTRHRCQRSVLRAAPCLLGLFTLISLIFNRLCCHSHANRPAHLSIHHTPCYHKTDPTFADALYAVRRLLWNGCLLQHLVGPRRVRTLPPRLKRTLLTYLAEAA